MRGPKLPVLQQLQKIASEVTRTTYPTTTPILDISDPSDIEWLTDTDVIIKRGYSDGSLHVIEVSAEDGKKKLEQLREETDRYYNVPGIMQQGLVPQWFSIPFIPEILSKGELRVYYIGGSLSHIMHTLPMGPGNIRIHRVTFVTPLCHLRYVFSVSMSYLKLTDDGSGTDDHVVQDLEEPSTPNLCDSTLPSVLQRQGLEEFQDFALKTYYALIEADEQSFTKFSQLRVFCRLDISVHFDAERRRYDFFVNEIAYTHKAVLFLHYLEQDKSRVTTDMAMALRGLVAYHRALNAESTTKGKGKGKARD